MIIHNVRLGHACNSSSTHSIIPAGNLADRSPRSGQGAYGWDWFVLRDPAEKMRYLSVMLRDFAQMDEDAVRDITGVWPHEDDYIDHQSDEVLPVPRGPYAEMFARDLAAFLARADVAILGGNDNDETPGEFENVDPIGIPQGVNPRPDVAPDGSRFWTIMSRYSGDKVRFTLDVEADQSPQPRVGVQYGTIPELVDMKITGFCPFSKDCPWCYMDSDAAGQHASQEDVARIMDECRRVGVFEIALGGGEPTLWPHLPWLAGYAKDAGINLNLTSKNFAWFSQAASEQTLKELSAVAFSVNNQRDLDRMKDLWTNEGPAGRGRLRTRMIWSVEGDAPEATVQCVPALLDDALIGQIVEFCREADIRVTFLGLKRTGRAQEHTQTDDLRWISALEGAEPRWLRYGVAVDTLMAAAASDAFQEAQISPAFYGVQEGAFSCYVDATTGRLGTSSYVPDSEMVPFTDSLPAAFVSAQIVSGVRPA